MANWLLFAILSAVFAALTAVFAKAGLKNVNPDLATAIRTVIILFMTWGIVFFKGVQKTSDLSKQNWIFLILSAFATGMSWLFYYRALQAGEVSKVSIIDKSSLILTILLAFIFLKEPLTWRVAAGGCLMVAGILVTVWK